ncbi:MAG: hypothetical protein SGCHY_000642 [Lobulomycetales sp.]
MSEPTDPAAAAAPPPAPAAEDMFAGMKKKKKKKVPVESPAGAADFSGLKKKKKKPLESSAGSTPSASTTDIDNLVDDPVPLVEAVAAQEEVEDFAHLLGKIKKKRRVDLTKFEAQLKEEGFEPKFHAQQEDILQGSTSESALSNDTDRDLTYQELLKRVFQILRQNNPELAGEKRKYTMIPPDVQREGSKKTAFSNLVDICKRMHRQPDHMIQFLFAELGTTGSIDGNQRLVIKGRFQQKQIENVLKRYIVEYVTCKTCKSADTLLTKENRLFFLQCEACGSTRTVSAIKTGFQAQIGRRAAQRA